MEVFVHRDPAGYMTDEMEGVQELGEMLTNYGPLGDDDEVTVEIKAPWSFIRDLLSLPVFGEIWFHSPT
jgi:hypothetical protein